MNSRGARLARARCSRDPGPHGRGGGWFNAVAEFPEGEVVAIANRADVGEAKDAEGV